MRSAKGKLKVMARLRGMTHLKPTLAGKTRWSGKFLMLSKFEKIKEHLIII